MTDGWQVKTVAECASSEPYSTQIGPFGKALMAYEYTVSGIPVLRGVNVNYGRFHDDDFVFITEEKANQLDKFESYPGDVLLVHKGTLGQIGIMPSKRKYRRYILGNSMMRVRCNPTKMLPEYLYYWLSSPDGQHYLFSRVSQVGVPQLQTPLTTLRQATLSVPPLPEQRAITHILEILDDKIDLNEQITKNLESISKIIFKHWFVDFEFPNEDGKPYKSNGGEMIDSELGKIPKLWKVSKLAECIDVIKGCSYRSVDLKKSETALVTLKSVNRGGGFNQDGYKEYVGEYNEEQVLRDGEIIVAQTDLTQKAEVVGRPAIVNSLHQYSKLIASLDLQIIRSKNNLSKNYIYYLLKTEEFHNHALSYTNGTTVLHLNKNAIPKYTSIIPSREILDKFDSIIEPILARISISETEIQALSQLRDLLLPKLMSGKIRVPVGVR